MTTLIAYVPVLHEGYRKFFEKYDGPKTLYIFGNEVIGEFPLLKKEIRQLDPETARTLISALSIFDRVELLTPEAARALNVAGMKLVLPDEEVSRTVAAEYFSDANVTFDPVFLRWDKHNALLERPVVPEERITREAFSIRVMELLKEEAEKSSDIWRHVGAAIVKNGEVVMKAHNAHLPTPHAPYVNGDPRNNFSKGQNIEYSTALHAEAALIAQAAKEGTSLEGTVMYVTVFPCPPCARLISRSGVQTLYCEGGYAVLDGEEVLKDAGVRIVFVEG